MSTSSNAVKTSGPKAIEDGKDNEEGTQRRAEEKVERHVPDNIPGMLCMYGQPTEQLQQPGKKIRARLRPLFEGLTRVGFRCSRTEQDCSDHVRYYGRRLPASTAPITARLRVQGQFTVLAGFYGIMDQCGQGSWTWTWSLPSMPLAQLSRSGTDVAVKPMAVNRYQGWAAAGW